SVRSERGEFARLRVEPGALAFLDGVDDDKVTVLAVQYHGPPPSLLFSTHHETRRGGAAEHVCAVERMAPVGSQPAFGCGGLASPGPAGEVSHPRRLQAMPTPRTIRILARDLTAWERCGRSAQSWGSRPPVHGGGRTSRRRSAGGRGGGVMWRT